MINATLSEIRSHHLRIIAERIDLARIWRLQTNPPPHDLVDYKTLKKILYPTYSVRRVRKPYIKRNDPRRLHPGEQLTELRYDNLHELIEWETPWGIDCVMTNHFGRLYQLEPPFYDDRDVYSKNNQGHITLHLSKYRAYDNPHLMRFNPHG